MAGEELTVTVRYEVPEAPTVVHVGVFIDRNDGVQVFGTSTHVAGVNPPTCSGHVRLRFPRLALLSGTYAVSVFLLDEHGLHVYDHRVREFTFTVVHDLKALGLCYLEHRWDIAQADERSGLSYLASGAARG